MWCSTCHQDVPAVAPVKGGRAVCARCQQPLHSTRPAAAAKICDAGLALDEPVAALAAAAPPLGGFDWHTRQSVRHMSRKLRRPGAVPSAAKICRAEPGPTTARRLQPPQDLFPEIEAAIGPAFTPIAARPSPHSAQTGQSRTGQVLAWLIVTAGALTLAGGVGLIAWSLSANQMQHWNLALGLTLGGQGTLAFGLVLVVARLWRNSRYASNKLHDVTARLAQLQRTADALAATRPGGAPAFYADLVRGASPHVLLANLKGQLDQLATRLGSGW